MIDEKINKTLSELEVGLRNIEAARKQVENIVNSYGELKGATSNYVESLSSVNENLKELVHAIRDDYNSKSESFEKDCKNISDSCYVLISAINKSVEDVKNNVSSSINKIHRKFTYVLICNFILFVTMVILHFLAGS